MTATNTTTISATPEAVTGACAGNSAHGLGHCSSSDTTPFLPIVGYSRAGPATW